MTWRNIKTDQPPGIRPAGELFGMDVYFDDNMTGDVIEIRDAETWQLLGTIRHPLPPPPEDKP